MTQSLDKYDIDEDAFALRDAMLKILANVESVFNSYNVPLPTRRYVTIGDPAIDCEQVVVSFMQMYLGTPGDEAAVPLACDGPKSIVVNITVARKLNVPKSGTPSAETIQDDSEWTLVDTFILMNSLAILNPWDGPGPGVIATSTSPNPEGGYEVAQMQLTVVLP